MIFFNSFRDRVNEENQGQFIGIKTDTHINLYQITEILADSANTGKSSLLTLNKTMTFNYICYKKFYYESISTTVIPAPPNSTCSS